MTASSTILLPVAGVLSGLACPQLVYQSASHECVPCSSPGKAELALLMGKVDGNDLEPLGMMFAFVLIIVVEVGFCSL